MAAGGAEEADAEAAVGSDRDRRPNGGTDEKPVGLVYIACCLNGDVRWRSAISTAPEQKYGNSQP